MMRTQPIVRVWLMLIALTAAAMLIGHVGGSGRIKTYEVALLLALTLFKSILVLRYYLGVEPSTPWFSGLISAVALLLGVVLALGIFA